MVWWSNGGPLFTRAYEDDATAQDVLQALRLTGAEAHSWKVEQRGRMSW